MAEHEHGSMDITTQEKVFEGFVKITIRVLIGIFAILVFLAIFNS